MPSPFPGMNPFLEQDDAWHDFHEKIIPAIAERLVVQVRPAYIVKIDEHVYVHELPPEPRRYLGRGDLAVSRCAEDRTGRGRKAGSRGGLGAHSNTQANCKQAAHSDNSHTEGEAQKGRITAPRPIASTHPCCPSSRR